MRTFAYLFALACLGCWYSAASLAQQPGPRTLENLLNPPDRAPLKPPPMDPDGSWPPALPDESAVKEAQDLIKQAYEDEYRTVEKNPEPLIQKLVAAAGQTKDPVRRYAFLLAAEEAALMGGDHGRVMELIDIRAGEFDVDEAQLRIERLAEFLTPKAKTDPEVLARLYEHAIETAEGGIKKNSPDQAKAAAEMAVSIAKSIFLAGKTKNNDGLADDGEAKQEQARALVKDIDRRTALFAAHQAALETLKSKPDDPEANGAAGRYLCFEMGDREKGLPFLAKGDQKEITEVVAQELKVFAAGTPDPREVFALAGKWWDVADVKKTPDSLRPSIKSHASGLYESIWERLEDPLDKAVAQKRRTQAVRAADGATIVEKRDEQAPGRVVFLSDLPEQGVFVGAGRFGKNGVNWDGKGQIVIAGKLSKKGLAMHPPNNGASTVTYAVPAGSTRFQATAAINDTGQGQVTPVVFRVLSGQRVLWQSKPIRGAGISVGCSVALNNAESITLQVSCLGHQHDAHAVWGDPRFLTK